MQYSILERNERWDIQFYNMFLGNSLDAARQIFIINWNSLLIILQPDERTDGRTDHHTDGQRRMDTFMPYGQYLQLCSICLLFLINLFMYVQRCVRPSSCLSVCLRQWIYVTYGIVHHHHHHHHRTPVKSVKYCLNWNSPSLVCGPSNSLFHMDDRLIVRMDAWSAK